MKTNMMKSQNRTSKSKTIVTLLVIVLILVVGALLSVFNPRAAGKAISIGGQPYLNDFVDLADKERVTFSFNLEEDHNELFFTARTAIFDPAVERYKLLIQDIDGTKASLSLFHIVQNIPQFVASDFLAIGEGLDSTQFYLDNDATPDISVVYANNVVTITNLHYFEPRSARVELSYLNGTNLGLIQRLDTNKFLQARIKATSTIPPNLSVTFTTTQNSALYNISYEVDPRGINYSIAYLNYTSGSQSAAIVMDINASVLGRNSHIYYTFAVGNIIYALAKPNALHLTLLYDEQRRVMLNTTLLATTALQPFATPCETPNDNAFFAIGNIKKIYSYDTPTSESQVAVPGLHVGDFDRFALWRGYFIEQKEPIATTITVPCTPVSVVPPSGVPLLDANVQRVRLDRGWNLLSLPGTVPRPLTDFTSDTKFKLIECSQGYSCIEIARDSVLYPGQPYWVYTNQALDIHYIEQR